MRRALMASVATAWFAFAGTAFSGWVVPAGAWAQDSAAPAILEDSDDARIQRVESDRYRLAIAARTRGEANRRAHARAARLAREQGFAFYEVLRSQARARQPRRNPSYIGPDSIITDSDQAARFPKPDRIVQTLDIRLRDERGTARRVYPATPD